MAIVLGCGADSVGVPGPDVRVSPAALTFPAVALGSSATSTFLITNVGTHAAVVSPGAFSDPAFLAVADLAGAVDADGAALGLDAARLVLPPGAKLPMHLTFTPKGAGPVAADLSITTEGDGVETYSDPRRPVVRMLALGAAPATAAARPWPYFPRQTDLGQPVQATTAHLTFSNAGTAAYTVTSGAILGCDRRFELVGAGLPAHVGAGAEADIGLIFTPAGPGGARCDVVFTTDVPGYPEVTATVAAGQSCGGDAPPTIELIAPTASVSIPRDRDATVTVAVNDDHWPVAALDCVVESAVLGAEIAACGLINTAATPIVVAVPDHYNGPTIDVWTVTVADACGSSAVSVPVIVDGTWPLDDEDGDAFGGTSPVDCDDHEPAAYPGGAEQADDIDNDCDGAVDEATGASDDDGDGFSEEAGDCDDQLAHVFPGAPEHGDGLDEDCDGAVDEGTTWGDDDADGLAERDGDCDDADPRRRPGAGEVLEDGVDDDCDGVIDEPGDDRIAPAVPVMTEIALSAAVVTPGDRVQAAVLAAGPATVVWSADGGELSPEEGPDTQWIAPDAVGTYHLIATQIGPSGALRLTTAVVEVRAGAPAVRLSDRGCATPGGAMLAALGGLVARRRRSPCRVG